VCFEWNFKNWPQTPKAHIRKTTLELPLYLRISGVQKDVHDKMKNKTVMHMA
jgi:hypothetical protein